MQITSNLKAVIANLERFEASLPTQVIAPVLVGITAPKFTVALVQCARIVLVGLVNSSPPERQGLLLKQVAFALATFNTAGSGPTAAHFRMSFRPPPVWRTIVPPPIGKRGRGRPRKEAGSKSQPIEVADDQAWANLGQDIQNWVTDEKRWKVERDGPRDEEGMRDKAKWILYVVTAPTAELAPLERTARDAFLNPAQSGDGLYEALVSPDALGHASPIGPDTARAWAQAVRHTWTVQLKLELPGHLRLRLRKLVREINTTML